MARCSISSTSASTARPDAAGTRRSRFWQTALGLGVSAVFLYLALKDESLADIGREIAGANFAWFLVSVVIATLTFPVRAVRWRIMLATTADIPHIGPVWRATAIGFMANNVLPARGGEVARAYVGSRFVGVPFTTVLGSIAVERVFDGLFILLLLAVAMADPRLTTAAAIEGRNIATGATWAGLVFALMLGVLFFVVHAPAGVMAYAARLARGLLPPRAAEFLIGLSRNFIEGLSILRAPRDFARVAVWSLVLWLVNAAAFYTGFLAFHLGHLPLTSALLLQGIVAIGVAIPAAPGFFGLFEYASKAGLGLYGVAATGAVSFAVGIHLGWFIPITVIGLWTLARANLSLGELRGRAEDTQ